MKVFARRAVLSVVMTVVLIVTQAGASSAVESPRDGESSAKADRRDAIVAQPAPAISSPVSPNEPGIAKQGFRVDRYVVEGNTLLGEGQIQKIVEPFTGTALDMNAINEAKNQLENAYRKVGYPTVLVTVPEQTIEEGTVRLLVVEGRIGKITVTGNEYFKKYELIGKLPSLKIGGVLYEPQFIKELDLLNVHPDRKVAPVLKPGEEMGLIHLELKVNDRLPVHGKVEADNKGPITTPRNRLMTEIQHTNLFGGDEIFTVSTVQTPTDWGKVQNYSASFVTPIKWPDQLISIYASKAISKSVLAGGTAFVGGGDVSIAGNATIAGVRYLRPLYKSESSQHTLSIGMDYRRLEKTEAMFPGSLGSAIVKSPIQYTPLSAAYVGTVQDTHGSSRAFATVKGYVAGMIPGGRKQDFTGNPNNPNDPGQRVGSTGTFAVLQGGMERVHLLPYGATLLLHVDGQWGTQPLVPAEQYFAGGMDTVRGYDNYEAVGDHAIRGRGEVMTPALQLPLDRIWQRRKSADWVLGVRGVAFYDGANLWVAQPQPGQTGTFRLEGTGLGLRVRFPKDLGELKIDQGWALRQSGVTQRGDTFVHFSVHTVF